MGRPKKTTGKELAVVEPEVTRKNPEDYIDYTSALVRLGVYMSNKAKNGNKSITDGTEESLYGIEQQAMELTSQQVQYLNMRMDGLSTKDACKSLQLDMAMPLLWETTADKDGVYACCLTVLEQIKAKQLEDFVIDKAMVDGDWRRDTVRMFVMKRFLPEYRENAPQAVSAVQVNISVANQPFEVVTETKSVGSNNG